MLKRFYQNASPVRLVTASVWCAVVVVLGICTVGQICNQVEKIRTKRAFDQADIERHQNEHARQGITSQVFAEDLDQLKTKLAANPDANWVGFYLHGKDDGSIAYAAKHVRELRVLTAMRATMDDSTLKLLSTQTELRRLDVWDTEVTDEGVKAMSTLTKLEDLWFGSSKLTDDGLVGLKSLISLRKLSLGDSISGAGLAHLADLTELREVGLHGIEVTDDGIASLKKLKHLEVVNLYHTGITDKGLASLGECKGLKQASLVKTAITDDGIQSLAKLDKLELLDVCDTAVTADGVARLKRSLPNLRVKYGPWSAANEGIGVLVDMGWFLGLAISTSVLGFFLESYVSRTAQGA